MGIQLPMTRQLTPRQRMLAAYTGAGSDLVPVAPEFWYFLPARLLGVSMIEFELEVPLWKALQHTFRHYGCEGWGIAMPGAPLPLGWKMEVRRSRLEEGGLAEETILHTGLRDLRCRRLLDPRQPSWMVERFIKDFEQDWPLYEKMTLEVPPEEMDWKPVNEALVAVGEDYLLEVYLGDAFVDFAGGQRQGGLEQVILDLRDHPQEMKARQEKYIHLMRRKTEAVFQQTQARSVFVGSIWSSLSLLSPALWRAWDRPVLEAVVQAAHACGGLVHHHFHGRCRKVIPELVALGLDCLCPFERPPGGDITDLPEVARLLGERVTFNGNVHTVQTLIRGRAADVRREVLEILEAFQGSRRVIVGTGDQVGGETPDENIYAMIETAREYGKDSGFPCIPGNSAATELTE